MNQGAITPISVILDGCQFSNFSIGAGTTNFTVSNAYRGLLFIMSSSTAACGAYFVYSTNSGKCESKTISALSGDYSINTSTNNIIGIVIPSGSVYALFITLNGSVSTS